MRCVMDWDGGECLRQVIAGLHRGRCDFSIGLIRTPSQDSQQGIEVKSAVH